MAYIYIFSFLLFISAPCFAEDPGPPSPDKDDGWFALGAGGDTDDDFNLAVNLNFGRKNIVQLGTRAAGIISYSSTYNISYGYSIVNRWVRAAALAGPSVYVHKNDWNDAAFGAQSGIQFIFSPVHELALGVELWGNLNGDNNTAGINLLIVIEGNK